MLSIKRKTQIRLFFHSSALVHHLLFWISLELTDLKKSENQAIEHFIDFKFLFMSAWNFMLQLIFLSMAVACDVQKLKVVSHAPTQFSRNFMKKAAKIRDFLYSTLVLPVGLSVGVFFWTVYYINRELIMPKDWDRSLPYFLNQTMHTSVIPIILLEMLIPKRRQNKRFQIAFLSGFILLYYACIIGAYFISGKWIYSVFGNFNLHQRFLIMLSFYALCLVFYRIGLRSNCAMTTLWSGLQKSANNRKKFRMK